MRTSCLDKCALISSTASLYRLCHQRQTSDTLHAAGQAFLPVQDMEVCGVHSVWVLHPDHDRHQHSGPHDEGKTAVINRQFKLQLLDVYILYIHISLPLNKGFFHLIFKMFLTLRWFFGIKWCAWIFSYEYVISNFVLLKACFTVLEYLSECRVSHYVSVFFLLL